jgi:hypothetical protein
MLFHLTNQSEYYRDSDKQSNNNPSGNRESRLLVVFIRKQSWILKSTVSSHQRKLSSSKDGVWVEIRHLQLSSEAYGSFWDEISPSCCLAKNLKGTEGWMKLTAMTQPRLHATHVQSNGGFGISLNQCIRIIIDVKYNAKICNIYFKLYFSSIHYGFKIQLIRSTQSVQRGSP